MLRLFKPVHHFPDYLQKLAFAQLHIPLAGGPRRGKLVGLGIRAGLSPLGNRSVDLLGASCKFLFSPEKIPT